jgi:hypothetical protein
MMLLSSPPILWKTHLPSSVRDAIALKQQMRPCAYASRSRSRLRWKAVAVSLRIKKAGETLPHHTVLPLFFPTEIIAEGHRNTA